MIKGAFLPLYEEGALRPTVTRAQVDAIYDQLKTATTDETIREWIEQEYTNTIKTLEASVAIAPYKQQDDLEGTLATTAPLFNAQRLS